MSSKRVGRETNRLNAMLIGIVFPDSGASNAGAYFFDPDFEFYAKVSPCNQFPTSRIVHPGQHTPYALDKKIPDFAQGLDLLRSQVALSLSLYIYIQDFVGSLRFADSILILHVEECSHAFRAIQADRHREHNESKKGFGSG